jgi:pilus assembly protein CpaB
VRASTIVMVGFAVVFGILAVFVAQSWLNRQAELRMRSLEAKKPVESQTVVVANAPLRFGTELAAKYLQEVEWPAQAIPAGTFHTVNDLLSSGRRVVLSPIEASEPIIGSKLTGPGQRATLSAVLQSGLKAVTVRVNDVEGVAGFVLPGDRVDVLLTRQTDKSDGSNDVVLQSARVLAIDQLADERSDKPAVVKAVTLEVDTIAAQKLSLAAQVGTLSLALRKAGETLPEGTRRVTLAEIGTAAMPVQARDVKNFATVTVTRATSRQDYHVPSEEVQREPARQVGF